MTTFWRLDGREIATPQLIGRILQHFHVADIEIRRPEIEETVRHIYEQKLLI